MKSVESVKSVSYWFCRSSYQRLYCAVPAVSRAKQWMIVPSGTLGKVAYFVVAAARRARHLITASSDMSEIRFRDRSGWQWEPDWARRPSKELIRLCEVAEPL